MGHDRNLYIGYFKENLKIHTGVPPLLSFPPLPSSPPPSPPFLYQLPLEVAGAPAGFQARGGKIRRKAPKNFFRLPTLVFSLPTLPYVTVAHPTEADLREKASLATNQEGPLPSPRSPPSDLALQLGLVIHTPGL